MDSKYRSVVNDEGFYVTFVLTDECNGECSIEYYELKEGEILIDIDAPRGFVRAKWNGENWVEGATAEEIAQWELDNPNPSIPNNIEDYSAQVIEEVSVACNEAIIAGCDVTLSDDTMEHFALEETDQINLTNAATAVAMGATGYPYHADGQLCRIYSADDINLISQAATNHKLYHTTYCNHLMTWARRCATTAELAEITYGATLPDDLYINMTEILALSGVT